MSKPVHIVLSLLVLLLTLLSANWFYKNFSWVNEKQEVGFQGIAKSNHLLGAEFFLRKMGIVVQQVNALTAFRDLPSTRYTILIATQRETINKDLSKHLLAWIKAGGHVIIEAKYFPDYSADNKNTSPPKEAADELLPDGLLFSKDTQASEDNKEFPVRLSVDNTIIEVNFPYYKTLDNSAYTTTPIRLIKDEIGQYLMQFPIGQGLLTVMTTTNMFSNNAITDYDHAQFLHYLVSQAGHNGGVWLIRVDDMPPLWQWLWNNARYMVLSLSILFLLWLWRMPFRFGPVLNDIQPQRRSLVEHIRAAGYYRWHNEQSEYLLQQVQNRLWLHIKKTHPAIPYDNKPKACKILAEITGIQYSLIKEALLTEGKLDEYGLTETIKLLELIKLRL